MSEPQWLRVFKCLQMQDNYCHLHHVSHSRWSADYSQNPWGLFWENWDFELSSCLVDSDITEVLKHTQDWETITEENFHIDSVLIWQLWETLFFRLQMQISFTFSSHSIQTPSKLESFSLFLNEMALRYWFPETLSYYNVRVAYWIVTFWTNSLRNPYSVFSSYSSPLLSQLTPIFPQIHPHLSPQLCVFFF